MLRLPILLLPLLLLAACATNEGARRGGFTDRTLKPTVQKRSVVRAKTGRRIRGHRTGSVETRRGKPIDPKRTEAPMQPGSSGGALPAQRRCWWVPRRDKDPTTRNRRERVCDWWRKRRP